MTAINLFYNTKNNILFANIYSYTKPVLEIL